MTERFDRQIFRLDAVHCILPKLTIGKTCVYGGVVRVEIVYPETTAGDESVWVTTGTSLARYLEYVGHRIIGTCTATYGSFGNAKDILQDPVVQTHLRRLQKEVRKVIRENISKRDESRREAASFEMRDLITRCERKYKLSSEVVSEIFTDTLNTISIEGVLKS